MKEGQSASLWDFRMFDGHNHGWHGAIGDLRS